MKGIVLIHEVKRYHVGKQSRGSLPRAKGPTQCRESAMQCKAVQCSQMQKMDSSCSCQRNIVNLLMRYNAINAND